MRGRGVWQDRLPQNLPSSRLSSGSSSSGSGRRAQMRRRLAAGGSLPSGSICGGRSARMGAETCLLLPHVFQHSRHLCTFVYVCVRVCVCGCMCNFVCVCACDFHDFTCQLTRFACLWLRVRLCMSVVVCVVVYVLMVVCV